MDAPTNFDVLVELADSTFFEEYYAYQRFDYDKATKHEQDYHDKAMAFQINYMLDNPRDFTAITGYSIGKYSKSATSVQNIKEIPMINETAYIFLNRIGLTSQCI